MTLQAVPESHPNSPARAYAHSSSSSSSSSSVPIHPTSVTDGVGGAELEKMLSARGVVPANAQALVAEHSAERVSSAIAWFDSQPAGSVGPGMLVRAVHEGRAPAPRKRSLVDEQRDYAASIVAWLQRHFPEFDRPVYGPHPAAVACVIRLHQRDGKGCLTKAAHGPEIRAAVRVWEQRWAS